MRKMIGKLILPVMAALLLVFAIFHVVRAQQTLPKPPPPVEPSRSPFGKTVAGAGIVEARTENIAIGTAMPGLVLKVFVPVEENGKRTFKEGTTNQLIGKTVLKGEPLFLVDNRQLLAQRAYARANLVSAEAQLEKLKAQPRTEEVPPSEALVSTAQKNLDLQQDLADRAERLVGTKAIAEEDYRQRVLAAAVARQQLTKAKADLALLKAGAWKKDIVIAQAAIEVSRAQLKQIDTDLDRALVRAPVNARVLQVNIRAGEYVGTPPSQALIVLGEIDKVVHVRVDVDEHDIPRFQKGAPARASIRGNPQITYPLKYVRVDPYVIPKKSLTGDNTERVDTRVLQVIYALDVTNRPIYVGQQLDVFIDVNRAATSAGKLSLR